MTKQLNAAVVAIACLLVLPVIAFTQSTYTWKQVAVNGGGYVPGIIFHPNVPGLAYARTDVGGLYRWDQTAGTWVQTLSWIPQDFFGYAGVWSVAVDPQVSDTVYAAVGMYSNGWDPNNAAVIKSTDRGNTWTVSPLPFKGHGNMPGRGNGERLAVDPNNSNILYLGGTGSQTEIYGLYKSTNAGSTWSKVTSFTAGGDWREETDPVQAFNYLNTYQGIAWVVFDPRFVSSGVTQHIYVGIASKTKPTVYRSTNGGSTWSAVAAQPLGDCGGNLLMPTKAALDEVSGSLYITYGYRVGPYQDEKGMVTKFDTATGVWTDISPVNNTCDPAGEGDPYFGYNGLSIDKQDPNTIMVTGHSSWWPDTQIFRSNDGGQTWSNIWRWDRYPRMIYQSNDLNTTTSPWYHHHEPAPRGGRPEPNAKGLGHMVSGLAIDPFNRNRFLYGTGGGIIGTEDALKWDNGNENSKFTLRTYAMGIEMTAVSALLSPPSGTPHLFSGMWDIRGFRHDNLDVAPNNYGGTWHSTNDMDFAGLNPNIMLRVGSYNWVEPGKNPPHASYSTNQGASWSGAGNVSGVTAMQGGGHCAVSADGATFIWAPADDPLNDDDESTWAPVPVSYSTDKGGTWTASSGVPTWSVVRADRVNPNKIYAFHQATGTFYRSTNKGVSFTDTGATGLPSSSATHAFTDVRCVPGFEGHIWLAGIEGNTEGVDYGLWRSTDSGSTFTKVAGVDFADSIGFGKAADGQTYPTLYMGGKVGGIRGLFRSTNQGVTWLRINDDMHQWGHRGKPITGDPRIFGRVYFGAWGIIYGDSSEGGPGDPGEPPGEATTTHIASIDAYTLNAGQGNRRGAADVTVLNDLGHPVSGALVSGTFSGSFNESVSATTNASGVATLTTTGTAKGSVSITFCVDDVEHGSLDYDPSANVVTCGN